VFHQLSTRFPHRPVGRRLGRLAAAAALLLVAASAGLGADGVSAPAVATPSSYRVFLVDGSLIATVGEFARTGDRVVLTIAIGDRLTMTTVPASQVDWDRTARYTDTVRAAHYAATRGEADFAAMSAVVARTLSDVAVTPGRGAQLALAERARRQLADWPREHFGYRADEVRQTLTLLDEVIAGLRAAAGQTSFDVAFVANVLPPPSEPVLPPIRFSRAGTPGFYLSFLRPALFAGGLVTNLDRSGARAAATTAGGQVDLRFTMLSSLDLTLSAGAGVRVAHGLPARREAMVSLALQK
jgi:hypothetical protein